MNIVEMARSEQGLAIKEMALMLEMSQEEYVELERECNFSVTDYLIICDILGLNFDAHL